MYPFVHNFTELLKDESCDVDLLGPTLPALKLLLDFPSNSSSEAHDKYCQTVHGLLSACLLNIDAMR